MKCVRKAQIVEHFETQVVLFTLSTHSFWDEARGGTVRTVIAACCGNGKIHSPARPKRSKDKGWKNLNALN